MKRHATLALVLSTVLATPALAHTGAGPVIGLSAGFAHPVGGLDHLLAMVAVGLWATTAGGRALWLLPLAFVGAMLAGGVIGVAGAGLPMIEAGIAGSVLLLGLALAARLRPAPLFAAAITAVFGLFHGHAHGTEMPLGAEASAYAAGFVVMTALLILAGVGLGTAAGRFAATATLAPRIAGLGIALTGAVLVAG